MTSIKRHMASIRRQEKLMIEVLLCSKNAERVLLYIFTREEGYAREIASFYNTDLKPIQMQLDKFEKGGILVSRSIGRTRPY